MSSGAKIRYYGDMEQTQYVEERPVAEDLGVPASARAGIDTIYSVSKREVIWRNFLAGASRAVGAVFVQTVGLLVFLVVLQQVVMPRLQPLITMLQKATSSMEQLQETSRAQQGLLENIPNQLQFDPNRFNQLLQQNTTTQPTPPPQVPAGGQQP